MACCADRRANLAPNNTTFASRYTQSIALSDLLRPDILALIQRKATGEKFLVMPARS